MTLQDTSTPYWSPPDLGIGAGDALAGCRVIVDRDEALTEITRRNNATAVA